MASYAKKLPSDSREWLNRFSEEYVCANMNHKGDRIHDTKELVKSIYDKNNARNRCIYTREKAQGCLNYLEDIASNKD